VVASAKIYNANLGREAAELDIFMADVSEFFPHVDVGLLSRCVANAIQQLKDKYPGVLYF